MERTHGTSTTSGRLPLVTARGWPFQVPQEHPRGVSRIPNRSLLHEPVCHTQTRATDPGETMPPRAKPTA